MSLITKKIVVESRMLGGGVWLTALGLRQIVLISHEDGKASDAG